MGAYLNIGIVKKHKVEVYCLLQISENIYEALEKLKGDIELDIYDVKRDGDYLELDIKKDLFTKENLINFLKEQYDKFEAYDKKKALEILDNIDDIGNVIDVLNEDQCENLYTFEDMCDYRIDGKEIRVRTEVIAYLSDGKFLMESYENTFNYFRHAIRKSSNNKLIKAVDFFIY